MPSCPVLHRQAAVIKAEWMSFIMAWTWCWDVGLWTGLMWFRIGTDGGHFSSHKVWGISW